VFILSLTFLGPVLALYGYEENCFAQDILGDSTSGAEEQTTGRKTCEFLFVFYQRLQL
jgi:hypothetical protein